MSKINETRHVSWYETCTCKCTIMIMINGAIMINEDVNAKNWLKEVDMIMVLFGILQSFAKYIWNILGFTENVDLN